ncbi:MAG: hypothetical protein LAO77_17740 [Acidobacteriia bacterium]|nr:hypothetical protein [Terriglobia bacterium]
MIRRLSVIAVLIALAPRPAAAQPTLELSGGAAIVRDQKNDVKLLGWYVEGATRIRPNIEIVVEGSQTYVAKDFVVGDLVIERNVIYRDNSIMAGARLSTKLWKLREYGQVLAGRVSASGSDATLVSTTPHLIVQPGVGLDFPLAKRLTLRMELGARFIGPDKQGNQNGFQFRFTSGFAVPLKK